MPCAETLQEASEENESYGMSGQVPAVIENNIDVITHWKDGSFVLGCSNLSGRYWNGSLWCFKSGDDAPDISKCITGVGTDYGVCDAVPFTQNKVIVGLDSGSIELISLIENPHLLETQFCAVEHDAPVSSLSINSSSSCLVSGSYDNSIRVLDLMTMRFLCTFKSVHSDIVWRVAFTSDPDVFLSCGQDGKLFTWDLRLPRPATVLGKNRAPAIPTAVAWQPQSTSQFSVGYETGQIVIKDIRSPALDVKELQLHKRPVFRLAYSSLCPSWLASCADETVLNVINVEKNCDVLYSNNKHQDFVRGLSWHPQTNKLYSSGWDKNVLSHTVLPTAMETGQGDEGDDMNSLGS